MELLIEPVEVLEPGIVRVAVLVDVPLEVRLGDRDIRGLEVVVLEGGVVRVAVLVDVALLVDTPDSVLRGVERELGLRAVVRVAVFVEWEDDVRIAAALINSLDARRLKASAPKSVKFQGVVDMCPSVDNKSIQRISLLCCMMNKFRRSISSNLAT